MTGADGDKCSQCRYGYYQATPSTCRPCGCDLGGAVSPQCDNNGYCTCRTGITGQTCSEPVEGTFSPSFDYFTYEAEVSTGHYNISYASSLYTGYGLVDVSIDSVLQFGSFTPPVSGLYDAVIRYSLLSSIGWQSAQLTLSRENISAPSPLTCEEISDGDTVTYTDWTIGQGQSTSRSLCLRGGVTYNLTLDQFIPINSHAMLLVDSLVLILRDSDHVLSLNDSGARYHYDNCVMHYKSLSLLNAILTDCNRISFTVMTEAFNGTLSEYIIMIIIMIYFYYFLGCSCNEFGSFNYSTCEQYSGQCTCKTGYTGLACSYCSPAYYYTAPLTCAGIYRNIIFNYTFFQVVAVMLMDQCLVYVIDPQDSVSVYLMSLDYHVTRAHVITSTLAHVNHVTAIC